jgi:hypothetical protein
LHGTRSGFGPVYLTANPAEFRNLARARSRKFNASAAQSNAQPKFAELAGAETVTHGS